MVSHPRLSQQRTSSLTIAAYRLVMFLARWIKALTLLMTGSAQQHAYKLPRPVLDAHVGRWSLLKIGAATREQFGQQNWQVSGGVV